MAGHKDGLIAILVKLMTLVRIWIPLTCDSSLFTASSSEQVHVVGSS